ncbi:MAG: hypothetical protein JSS86_09500 [Cyanobacteria bacterium SZAS LIN-2]|nr:hypothetical protein [Cyanobacteria bacterium SZAS LIN-3]MBS1996534.1 hypothetical protein [Cyanobacteria bacterium SZAS LIN-2]MBS2007987.1 hypothetical protein [Cyanobacteria bacterium SZAS TMP-1]
MVKSKHDGNFEDCNVIYSECCFTMAKRFERLGRKYENMGRLDLAERLQEEATIQLDAWRRARDERRLAS